MNQHPTLEPADERNEAMQLSRREAVQWVAAVFGGAALAGGDPLAALAFDAAAREAAAAQGAGAFTAQDIALLDEIADTILPETKSPGAKAAKTGAFMALMVSETYTDTNQRVFRDGLRQLDEECARQHGAPFLKASPAQRLALLETLDREQHAAVAARAADRPTRAPIELRAGLGEPPHYFRLMKELALLGYFTSEIGCTRAMRYRESPGRFDPCAEHKPGDTIWAAHA
jgi:hypothetical protein